MQRNLHVHGESANDTIGQFGGGRTSPDAWRKLNSHTNGILTSGDISAYAEKTVRPYSDEPNNRDTSRCVEKTSVPCPMLRAPLEHLHVHGETGLNSPSIHGITRHLHMRGENLHIVIQLPTESGTSPHAWRKPMACAQWGVPEGNISTYVEKTGERPTTILRSGTSPRMRRER